MMAAAMLLCSPMKRSQNVNFIDNGLRNLKKG